MGEIGEWMLEQACRQAVTWPAHVTVAVNLSPAEFLRKGLTDRVAQILDSTGLPPERLELEITESVLLERTTNNLDTLHTLEVLGVRISLDDFGTRYSSLAYLKNFPSIRSRSTDTSSRMSIATRIARQSSVSSSRLPIDWEYGFPRKALRLQLRQTGFGKEGAIGCKGIC